jgi:hypothetical protein
MISDLEKHKIYVKDLGMEVVPYSIAVQALVEVQEQSLSKIDQTLEHLNKALTDLNQPDDKTFS